MIILGSKKNQAGSIVANIRDKMDGKGSSHDDMKYDHERSDQQGEESRHDLEHAAGLIMDAFHGSDISKMQHALNDKDRTWKIPHSLKTPSLTTI